MCKTEPKKIEILLVKIEYFYSFASPKRPRCVDYRRFVEVIEEALAQGSLERDPMLVPIQHVPTKDCDRNFLNFEERHILSMAMEKLAKKPDITHELWSLFKVLIWLKAHLDRFERFLPASDFVSF